MLRAKLYLPFILAMCAVVAASNYLVQFPVQATLGGINLADILTWGAFTYPVAFLVTDLTNRRFGANAARVVVVSGFVLAVALSIWLATPRIAIASGSAFLVAQLLDVAVFEKLRRSAWWKAPLVSSLLGSVIDTVLFFGVAFSAPFAFIDLNYGMEDGSLAVGLFNLAEQPRTITVTWKDLGLTGPQRVRDLWRQKDLAPADRSCNATVNRHGVMLLRLWPKH